MRKKSRWTAISRKENIVSNSHRTKEEALLWWAPSRKRGNDNRKERNEKKGSRPRAKKMEKKERRQQHQRRREKKEKRKKGTVLLQLCRNGLEGLRKRERNGRKRRIWRPPSTEGKKGRVRSMKKRRGAFVDRGSLQGRGIKEKDRGDWSGEKGRGKKAAPTTITKKKELTSPPFSSQNKLPRERGPERRGREHLCVLQTLRTKKAAKEREEKLTCRIINVQKEE